VGRNYREHAAELGNAPPTEPLIFLKPVSALVAHGDAILYPSISARVITRASWAWSSAAGHGT